MAWPNGTRLKSFVAGGSFLPGDGNNIEDRMLQIAGHRGKSIIVTEETRTNAAYGKLTTADEVTGIVLPTDGFIVIAYHAMWKNSAVSQGQAALFLGANQLKIAGTGAAPTTTDAEAAGNATVDTYRLLATRIDQGLVSGGGATAYTGDVTTGQILAERTTAGGPVSVFAAAGTYDISVQFRSTSGSVTVKNRKLWVWTMGFD